MAILSSTLSFFVLLVNQMLDLRNRLITIVPIDFEIFQSGPAWRVDPLADAAQQLSLTKPQRTSGSGGEIRR